MTLTFVAGTGMDQAVVFGNLRFASGTLNLLAATTGATNVGLDTVYGATLTPLSQTSSSWGVVLNTGETGTSIAGEICIKSAVAGDKFHVAAWGV